MERWARKLAALLVLLATFACVTGPSGARPRKTLRVKCWERSVNQRDGWVRLYFRSEPWRTPDGHVVTQSMIVFFELENDPLIEPTEYATVTFQGDGPEQVDPFFK